MTPPGSQSRNGLRIRDFVRIIQGEMIQMNALPLVLVSSLSVLLAACGSSRPASSIPSSTAAPPSQPSVAMPSAAATATPDAQVSAHPVAQSPKVDSTSPPPRPTVLIPGQNTFAVRTKLVPRVMGSGWVLMVNKPDSLEFFRPADSILTTYLFGLSPAPGQRLRLRFILKGEGDGTRIALMGHLIGKDGPLPYVAQEAPLVENLTSLQADLLAAPPMQPPEKSGKKKKK